MRVYRIARKPFVRSPLDGRGGLFASGRWHAARRLIVYTSDSLALASLEVLVHSDLDLIPQDLIAIEIHIPDDLKIHRLSASKLPRNWRSYPGPISLQKLGNAWLDAGQSLLLRVPSAVIPSEYNFLINPRHPEISKLRISRKFPFRFDPRVISH